MSYPTDPEASSSPEKVSSVEEEHELLFENDVGIYLGNPTTDNEKKFKVFQNPWMPPLSYKFPVTMSFFPTPLNGTIFLARIFRCCQRCSL